MSVPSENEKESEYKATIEDLNRSIDQMVTEKLDLFNELHQMKQQSIDPEFLQAEHDRHQFEIDKLSQKFVSKHEHEKHLLESDFQLKMSQLMESSDIELNQVRQRLEDKQLQFERMDTEKKVLESSFGNCQSENERLLHQIEAQVNTSKELLHKLEVKLIVSAIKISS